MSLPDRHILLTGALAAAAGAALGLHAATALASVTYASNTSTITNVEQTYQSGGTSRITAEGIGAGSYANFGVMDIGGATFGPSSGGYTSTSVPTITYANGTPGVPAGTSVTGVNSITVSLTDKDEGFASSGPMDVYLSNNNGSLSGASFQTANGGTSNGANDGIGNQLGTLTTTSSTLPGDSLVQLNSSPVTYTAGAADGGPGGSA
jgi:hypothetical protein